MLITRWYVSIVLFLLIQSLLFAQTAKNYTGALTRPVGNNAGNLLKWSNPATWNNNRVPLTTDNVTIPSGSAVVIDQDITVKNIMVHGTLVVDPTKNINISTHSIELMGLQAYWEWGTEANPYQFKGTLTFSQSSPTETTPMEGMEPKGIIVMSGATIALHGKVKRSWTILNATANAGANNIVLKDAVDWAVGDSILVASTDWSMAENETFRIQAISTDRRTITLSSPLKNTHWGTTETFSNATRSWTLDERGEVALLTRNILIQGDAASEVDNKGVYFMIMETAVAKVSGVELFRTGLGGILARYPFHWHMANNVAGQYIKNSSIHRAYNRAITVHGSQNALVDNNVCYDVIGHAIFLEDGIEYGNTISSNFVATVKKPEAGKELLASDVLVGVDNRATGPAGLWITHPNNVVINNHVSGAGSGVWYALPSNPTGMSFNNGRGIQNRKIPIRRFENNSTHSCAVGVTFDYSSKQDSEGNIIGVETAHYDPTVYTLVQRIQSFKNIRGIWFRGSNQVGFAEFVLADNQGNGSFIPTFKSRFSNGCTIGYSANNTNINFPTFGTSFYDGAQEIYNCHFENFDQPNQSIFNIFGGANKSIYNQVSGLTYKKCNIYNPYGTLEASPHNSFAIDMDGSLTGRANDMMCLDHPFYVDTIPGNFTPFNETYGWGRKTSLKFGQVKIDRTAVIKNSMFYYEWADGHSMHDTGVPGSPFGQMTMAVNTNRLYKLRFVDFIPAATNLTLYSSYRAGDRVTFVIQGSPVELIISGNGIQRMTSLAAFNAATSNASYWANNELYVKMYATGANYVAGGTFALRTINNQTATPIKLKSRPYRRGGHPLNTTIQAEEFDYGGQNVAYYSDRLTSSDVLPSGKYNHSTEVRLGEIVLLNKSFTTRQGTVETVIEKTKPNEYWNYTCSIPADGNYDIVMNLGAANASNRVQVLVNDVVVKDSTFARLGATNDLKSFVFPKLALRRGLQVVTFKVFSSNLVFNSFTITPPNIPPVVTLTSPQQTRTNFALATVTLTATATDANGISRVEFYQGTRLVGTDVTAPYVLTLSGLNVGTHVFRARAFDALNLTATSTGLTIVVSPLVCLVTMTNSSPLTFCQGGSVLLSASTGSSYLWMRGNASVSTNRNFTATATGLYSVIVSQSNGCKDTSLVKSVVVNPLPIAAITASGATTFCQGNSVLLNSSLGNSYAWSRNGTVVGLSRTLVASVSGAYIVGVTNANGCTAYSAPITVSVTGLVPVSVSLVSSAATVCSGAGVSFTATGVNAGLSPRYQWIVNNIPRALGSIFTYNPADGDLVRVALTASGTCLSGSPANSSSVQMRVSPLLAPAISVSPSVNPTCSNTGVIYTALSTNSGTIPTYRWMVNGTLRTGSTTSFAYTPSNGDVIQAALTTGGTMPTCLVASAVTSTGIVAKVNATIPTTLSIIPSSTTVCQGASVRFTTSASGTGSSPVYAWYVNSALQSNTTSSFTFVPSNGQTVRATMLPGGTGLTCVVGGMATSLGVALNVNAVQNITASILASTNTVCSGGTAYFTATGSNLGTSPTFTWLVNGQVQGNGNPFSYSPTSNALVTAISQVGGTIPACLVQTVATTTSVAIGTISPVSPSISVVSSALSVCSGAGITMTASGINGGSSPSFTWIKNGAVVSVGAKLTFVPSDGDQIKAVMQAGGNLPNCLAANADTTTVLDIQVDPLTQSNIQISTSITTLCTETGISVLANTTLAGSNPQINWYVNNVVAGQGSTFNFTPNHGDQIQAVLILSGNLPTCLTTTSASSNLISFTVNACLPPVITSISGPAFVSMSNSTAIYSVPSVPGDTYEWNLPAGITLLDGQGTSQIRVQYTDIVTGNISLTQTNTYGNTTVSTEVHSGVPPIVSEIQGDTTILENSSNVVFSVASSPGTSYQWSVPTGVTIVSGQGTNQLVLNVSNGVLGALSLTSTNVYGSTSQSITLVTGALPVVPAITGPSQVSAGQTDVIYSVQSQDETTYFWSINSSDTLVTGQGTYSIVVNFGSSPSGSIQVLATNDFGSASASLAVSELVITDLSLQSIPSEIVLYPNPTQGTFSIKLGHGLTDVTISILDIKGVEVLGEQSSTTGLGANLPSGHYIVRIKSNAGIKHLPLVKFE